MCGLVGILQRRDKPVGRDVLAHMLAVLHHRGPDEDGYFVEAPIGLCHKRLTMIDSGAGRQAMQADGIGMVFDGEIYIYGEVRSELIQRGDTFRTKSDTE